MILSVDSLMDTIGGGATQQTFTIQNPGNGPLDYSIDVTYGGTLNPTPWDSVGLIPVSNVTGNWQMWGQPLQARSSPRGFAVTNGVLRNNHRNAKG